MSLHHQEPLHSCRYAGLGNTVKEIDVSDAKVFSKTVFSMVIPEVEKLIEQDANRKSVVLFGIEVCTMDHKFNIFKFVAHTRSFH